MKTMLTAIALAATLAQPAAAITFPSLTTIYVGAGAFSVGNDLSGTATVVVCSNVSGVAASIRVLMLNDNGGIEGQATVTTGHGGSEVFFTHPIIPFGGEDLQTGSFIGVINIEATQSGVFCTARIMNGEGPAQDAAPLDLVRVNPHPGTVE